MISSSSSATVQVTFIAFHFEAFRPMFPENSLKSNRIVHQTYLENTCHIRPIASPGTRRNELSKDILLPKKSKINKPKSLDLLIEEAQHAQEVRNEAASKPQTNEKIKKLFKDSEEFSHIAKQLQDDIIETSANDIEWSSVMGLEEAKRVLKESIILPMLYPKLFKGLLQPWRGVLLYGLPGSGKTYLAKAVSHESSSTFFNIPASSVVSKYRGESEKIIRVLFTVARHHAPSIIFFDEADAIMGNRSSYGGGELQEHEGSRRMKTELLVEMDGINTGDDHLFVLAATNLPWEIDIAFLRRLEKRILVPLPDKKTIISLIRLHLQEHINFLKSQDLNRLTDLLDGFSACDIKQVCKEVVMAKVRTLLDRLTHNTNSKLPEIEDLDLDDILKNDPITFAEIETSINTTKRTTSSDWIQRYKEWELNY
jgi:katanin p60 ATPase-containing subunit A1